MNQILATGSIVLTRTDGTITYAHIRYSPNADGSNMTEKPNDATRYIGVCYNSSSEPPTDKNNYTWSLIKGSNGEDPKEIEKSAPIYKILDKFKTISVSASDWSTKYSRYYILENNRYRQCTINDAWSSIETYYIIDTEAPIAPTTEVKANSPVDGWSLEIPTYIYGKQYWVCLQTVFQSSGSIPNTDDSITGMYLDENSDTIVNTIDDESIIDRTYFDANGNLIIELKEGEYGKHEDPNDNEYINSSYVDDNGQLVLVLNKSEIPIYEDVIWSEVVLHDGLNEANEKAALAKDTSDDAYTMANGSVDKIIYWYCAATYGDNEKSPRAPNNTAGWFKDPSKTDFGKQIKINNEVQKYNYLWIYPVYYYRNGTNSNGINPSTSTELSNDKIQIYASVSNTMLGLWTFLAGDSIGEGATTINGGNITANSITATEIGTFGNFTIDTDSIHNPSTKNTFDNNEEGIYISGTNGIKLNAPNNIEFSVNSSTGLLTANNANIIGNLYADKGYIGGNNGFIIDTNKIYRNKSTLKSSDGGIYLGTDGISVTTSGTYSYNNISGYSSKSFIKDGDYYKSNFTSNSTDFTIGKISLSEISSGDIITVFYEICGDSNSTAIFGNLGVNSGTGNNTIKTNTTIDSTQICTQVNCSSGGSVKTGQISYTAVENANYNFFIVKIVGNKNSYVKFTLSVGVTNQEYTTTITNGILYTNKIIATDCEFSGNINVNNGVFKVDSAGNLVAQKATITGTVNATNGVFNNCTIGNSCTINGDITANQITSGTLNCGNLTISNLTADDIKSGTLDLTEGIAIGGKNCATTINQNSIVFDNGSSYTGIGVSGLQASIRKWSSVTISDGGSNATSNPHILAFQSFGPIIFIRIYATFNKNSYSASTWYHVATIKNAPLPNTTYYSCTKSGTRIMRYYINSSGQIYASPSGSGYTTKKAVTKYANFWYFSNDIASKYPISFDDGEEDDDDDETE